jgi:hypothetical protein
LLAARSAEAIEQFSTGHGRRESTTVRRDFSWSGLGGAAAETGQIQDEEQRADGTNRNTDPGDEEGENDPDHAQR